MLDASKSPFKEKAVEFAKFGEMWAKSCRRRRKVDRHRPNLVEASENSAEVAPMSFIPGQRWRISGQLRLKCLTSRPDSPPECLCHARPKWGRLLCVEVAVELGLPFADPAIFGTISAGFGRSWPGECGDQVGAMSTDADG